jgi:hypothetical protein
VVVAVNSQDPCKHLELSKDERLDLLDLTLIIGRLVFVPEFLIDFGNFIKDVQGLIVMEVIFVCCLEFFEC